MQNAEWGRQSGGKMQTEQTVVKEGFKGKKYHKYMKTITL